MHLFSLLRRAALFLLPGVLLLPSVTVAEGSKTPLRVTVTVPPLVWLVSQVAGPEVIVDDLIKVGENAETFQPTDRQITGVARSALFFRIGVEAENGPWLKALESSRTLAVVDLRQGLELRAMAHGGHSHGGHHHRGGRHGAHGSHRTSSSGHPHHESLDPHTWLSPRRLAIMAQTIARHLAEADPAGAEGYAERAKTVVAGLEALDGELRLRLAPVAGRAFFVFHPAWGYFADDYGLEQIAIEIEGKEPSERELTQLVRRARELHMRTLFVEPMVQSAAPAMLARAVGARVESLDPLATDLPNHLRHAAERIRAALEPAEDDR